MHGRMLIRCLPQLVLSDQQANHSSSVGSLPFGRGALPLAWSRFLLDRSEVLDNTVRSSKYSNPLSFQQPHCFVILRKSYIE
jgi:hypothetical protein